MSKSMRVSEREMREMISLAGELGELRGAGADGHAWVGHLLAGVCELTGAAAASHVVGRGTHPTREPRLVSADVAGFDEAMMRLSGEFMRTGEPPDIIAHALTARDAGRARGGGVRVAVDTLDRLMPRSRWHGSPHFHDFLRAMGLDDPLHVAVAPDRAETLPTDGAHVRVFRAVRDRPFGAREREVTELLFSAIHWMYDPPPPVVAAPAERSWAGLPPRTREVGGLLLEGLSEKEVARRLGLSRHTVHDHVKLLYRHVTVSSRAEFMAKCGRG